VTPLGGLGEIGKNLTVIEYGDDAILVDCGLRFPDAVEYPGVDLILPDFSYLRELGPRIRGVLVTHGHEDHIGGLAFLAKEMPLNIFGSAYALRLAEHRIEEQGQLSRVRLFEVKPGGRFELGPFKIEAFSVCHSIVSGMGMAIKTPLGTIVHTGDFKFDADPVDGVKVDHSALKRFGDEGVLLLMSDSTNVERPGWIPSERSVGPALEKVIADAPRRVILTSFASHVHRFQQVLEAASKAGRKVATLGRSMNDNMKLANELGLLKVPDGVWKDFSELKSADPRKTVIVSTGSQAEMNSGLRRLAKGEHSDLSIEPGDTVVYSARAIPGNERAISRLINDFCRHGATVITEDQETVHVSGHGSREDLREMLRLTRPRYFLPGHGELRHQIAHRALAYDEGVTHDRVFVLENGQPWVFDGQEAFIGESVTSGEVLVDGLGVGEELVLRDRRHLNEAGMVVCMLGLSRKTGEILSGPDILMRGVASEADGEIMDEAREVVRAALAERQHTDARNWDLAREIITTALKRYFKKRLARRPVILPAVMEL